LCIFKTKRVAYHKSCKLKEEIQGGDQNENEETLKRSDLILKSILRQMRQFYKKDFNKFTRYMIKKRYKTEGFYLESVK
jgi:hypothetical protein